MKNDPIDRLPPPPLFTLRPPPKPPGDFHELQSLNGQCIRKSLDILPSNHHPFNWLNIFLLILAIISVLSCLIIIIFIFICLKKLKKEEKEYKTYVMTGSLSSTTRPTHSDISRRTNENYQCRSNCCIDDYYSHQISNPTRTLSSINPCDSSSSPHHQYECIPEYLLTIKRHCQSQHHSSLPYATFSRSYIRHEDPKNSKEESSTPLISSSLIPSEESQSMIIGWTRRNSSSIEQRQKESLLSQLTSSTLFK